MTIWTLCDDPRNHPLWETQVNLERGMMRAGAQKVSDQVLMAERRGQMTRTTVVRGLLTEWLPGVAASIKSWVSDVEKSKGGPKPIAYPYIKQLDPYVAALVALRAVLDGIAKERQRLAGLAMHIGRTCEHELRVRHWESLEPELFYHYDRDLDRNKSTATHRRRVNINRFNALVDEGLLTWESWPEEVRFRVGVALLDCIIRKTGWFELQDDPGHVWRRGANRVPNLVVAAKPGMLEWLGRELDNAELREPAFRPTVIPPKRWGGSGQGGYFTPYVQTPRLVRFKASQESQRTMAALEYDAIDMPQVYTALNMLQETAWRVNRRVLDVAKAVWSKSGDGGVAGLPQIVERPLPARTPRHVECAEAERLAKIEHRVPPKRDEQTDREILQWKRKASAVYKFNAKRYSKSRSTSDCILVADQYAGFERIYFPHMLDFRGRFYPIPSFLHPQGNDLARGLLTFADTLPLTEENGGGWWLAVHLANVWGNDKVPFDKRVAWVEENEELWRRIEADPLANREWAVTQGPDKVDKPFQALAAIFEWVAFLNHGWGFESRLPVMVDGTCNGIQHLSAILRDKVAGRFVNLVPGDEPQDIYRVVAQGAPAVFEDGTDGLAYEAVVGLQADLERIHRAGGIEGRKAAYWLELTGYALPRTLTKRPVMVLPYGGTKDSFFTYTREWLDERDPAPTSVEDMEEAQGNHTPLVEECLLHGILSHDEEGNPKDPMALVHELRTKRITFMAGHMWNTVNSVVKSGMLVMDWLQRCAKAVAVANQPIYWEVPSGFVVRHFYGLDKSIQVKVMLDGERYDIRRVEKTAELSTKEQTQGIAPNFIHSLDASALVDCIERCRVAGIEDFVAVHDAYGTHAANMGALSVLLREAFVATHRVDVLGNFRAACERVLVDHLVAEKNMDPLAASERANELLPPPLEKGDLDIEAVLESSYFFA